MDICFDTSAINAIADSEAKAEIISHLRRNHRVLLTSLNLLEIVATPTDARRLELLNTMKELSDGALPLAIPTKILRRATRAFAKRKPTFNIDIAQEDAPLWWMLQDADEAGPEQQAEARQWLMSLEQPFDKAHRQARPGFQELFGSNENERPKSPGHMLKLFALQNNSDAMYHFVRNVYKKESRQHLSVDAMWRLFKVVPYWPLYLAGWAHQMYARAVSEQDYGRRKKPGTIDLWCAVYLPHCDVFVTCDNGQYRALRLLNVLSMRKPPQATRTRVILFGSFERRLLS